MKLAYYNDKFNLRRGDLVYVDGKLEGMLGLVVDVSNNFKIKLSDYKRVIAVADTKVQGEFFMAGSHLVAFDSKALPREKVITWFKPPESDDEEYITEKDSDSFMLNDLSDMKINGVEAECGDDYYLSRKVKYVSIDGTRGYAIVEGTKPYEVEFDYNDGEISGLVCSCYCPANCRHGFAALLQLKEVLDTIKKYYAEKFEHTNYFAAINKGTLFAFAIHVKETGCIKLL